MSGMERLQRMLGIYQVGAGFICRSRGGLGPARVPSVFP